MGKLIVLEGLDGSGKTTQTPLLADALRALGLSVCCISFPDYEQPSSALVKMYLGGEFGSDPSDVNAYAASAFYAVDRFASYRKFWQEDYLSDTLILATRYTTSNAYHQLAKLPREEWGAYLHWLEDFEYEKLGIPRPDAVIFLDMDPAVSTGLVKARSGENADIHEKNYTYMRNCRDAAVYASDYFGWERILCYAQDRPLPLEEVTEKVVAAARRILKI